MSVLVQTPDGWETVAEANAINVDGGMLGCLGKNPAGHLSTVKWIVAVYAPGQWLYAEVTE